jgi:hypothetical protein
MNLQRRKNNIIYYINEFLDQNEAWFDGPNRIFGFDSYNDFVEHQEKNINNLTEKEIVVFETLINLMLNINIIDIDNMTEQPSGGFIINKKNEISIYPCLC